MKKILLDDLLHISPDIVNTVKIKFNQNNGFDDPMDLYLREPEIVNTQWLFWQTKQRYFNVGQIAVCFLKLSPDTWLKTAIPILSLNTARNASLLLKQLFVYHSEIVL